ncbi:MAG: DNA-3-methyladenine glycosylase [Myxococcota bacterium]|mgnify:FL=1|jgi:DNA-3-methyladenine glycosylase II|nr:DNA-3-methyladenine glycosylase [Myxococcota bacterium]
MSFTLSHFPHWDQAVSELTAADPVMADLISQFPGERLEPKGEGFETLIRAIVGQQISVKAAQAVWDRTVASVGSITPSAFLEADEEQLRACGLSRQKVRYLRGIAQEPDRCDPLHLSSLSDAAVLAELTAYKGVGEWTAQMFMMFTLCRPDILSLKDIGLRRAVERHYAEGRRLDDGEIEAIAEPWRPWRSVATWFLWRSLDPIPVAY